MTLFCLDEQTIVDETSWNEINIETINPTYQVEKGNEGAKGKPAFSSGVKPLNKLLEGKCTLSIYIPST